MDEKKINNQHQSANKSNSFPTFRTDLPVLLHSCRSHSPHEKRNRSQNANVAKTKSMINEQKYYW